MPNILTDLDSSLFRINMPTRKPATGRLLVAEPFLREEHFNHAVIQLIEYASGQNSMGLVLNKPTNLTLGEAIEGVSDDVDIPLFCGGPVGNDRLFYIHSLPSEFPEAIPLGNNLFIGGDFDRVKSYLNMGLPTEGKIRFFIGYSGWEIGQLDNEISNHVWAVAPQIIDTQILLNNEGESYWYDVVRTMGPSYRNWLYHPTNPKLN